jgi:hypothetical protein
MALDQSNIFGRNLMTHCYCPHCGRRYGGDGASVYPHLNPPSNVYAPTIVVDDVDVNDEALRPEDV